MAACFADAACAECLVDAYTPACDALPLYHALTQCGCLDAGTIPPEVSCLDCTMSWAKCDSTGKGCQQWEQQEDILEACLDCLGPSPNPGVCNVPDLAPLLQCACAADKCATQCATACQQFENPQTDSGIADAPKESSSWDGGYHTCSSDADCTQWMGAHCVDPMGVLGYAICLNCMYPGQPASCPSGQTCVDYLCE